MTKSAATPTRMRGNPKTTPVTPKSSPAERRDWGRRRNQSSSRWKYRRWCNIRTVFTRRRWSVIRRPTPASGCHKGFGGKNSSLGLKRKELQQVGGKEGGGTVGQNQVVLRHRSIHFPKSSGVISASESANGEVSVPEVRSRFLAVLNHSGGGGVKGGIRIEKQRKSSSLG